MRKIRLLICGVSAAAFLALGDPVWAHGILSQTAQLPQTPASQHPSLPPRPTAPQTVAATPAAAGWTLVPASDWSARAPGLVGNRVEVSGNLSTQLMVNPRSSFSNTGWMRDAGTRVDAEEQVQSDLRWSVRSWRSHERARESRAGVADD